MATKVEMIKTCNKCANFFADTVDVEYFTGDIDEDEELNWHYKEYFADANGWFPELAKFF